MPREAPSWDPNRYLQFEKERTQPCRDLVARIDLDSVPFAVDLGCGPGNSTRVLAERWPGAKITGIDSSAEMLEKARKSEVRAEWKLADIRDWTPVAPVELVFSNAVFQWLPDADAQLPRLLKSVSEGGAFAFQVPSGEGRWVDAIREVAGTARWRGVFPETALSLGTPDVSHHYDLLSPVAERVEVWQTEYVHLFEAPETVVEWTSGSALRPILDRLTKKHDRESFLSDYTAAIVEAYPRRPSGKVLFPFLRRFVVAYR